MELSQTIHGRGLLIASLLLLINFYLASSSLPQGNRLPYMTSDVEEVSGKSFDYIVVGGGTAGCALAATLSEKFSVLLVERGGSPYGNPLVLDKKYYGFALIETDKYTSVAQSFVSKDGVMNQRGRVLGGSSAINFGFYSRASECFIEKVGLEKELVRDAYEWVESRIVSKPELTLWQIVAEFGLLEAGILPYNGFSLEHIEGTKVGATVFDEHGIRHTSADLLEAGNPENITVLLNATVKNVIFYNENRNESRAWGIRFIKSNGSPDQTHEVYLNQPECSSSWGELPDTPQVVGIADNFKFIVEAGIVPVSLNATRMTVAAKLAFPASKGKLELNSTDPRENPSVQFNYLAKEKDMDECVKMSQLLERVARSQSIAMFVGVEHKSKLMSSEDELRKSCKKNVRTFYHYHGGCTVGSVVDKDYKVYGVEGLRVVDGSTFLESPGTNPMATLLMLGRYQGIKILKEKSDAGAFNTQQQTP
ncbi:hypothetical protein SO802_011426 [Lithocarpus litseifolius]|uniref:Glucose-methanol-choline oxidoreductase N-terminal domain-containing protein n=1 Tax=Lithocarpus litseifolius TaxID=425828 RepID=A0AAW2D426_9ROSI